VADSPAPAPVRDAATVILLRDGPDLAVLMGRRGARAAFMPDKMVFPGGAIDRHDADTPLAALPDPTCCARLADGCAPDRARTMARAAATAAIRELWEETGLILGRPAPWPDAPGDWAGFAATGHRPDASALRFVFRAITPPGRPRRFDTRFFLADATAIAGDPDDFSRAGDELTALQWVPLAEIRRHDLPFITEVVLAEIAALRGTHGPPPSVPFFDNDDEARLFRRLHGGAAGNGADQ
jgi:8-oxo-dGTP pyrophosphatase MutT (NUDIX family)